jgi:hypothetical protein
MSEMEERFRAHDWLASHPVEVSRHVGRWVAVTPGGIVASAGSLRELLRKTAALPRKPLLFQVPDPAKTYVLAGA